MSSGNVIPDRVLPLSTCGRCADPRAQSGMRQELTLVDIFCETRGRSPSRNAFKSRLDARETTWHQGNSTGTLREEMDTIQCKEVNEVYLSRDVRQFRNVLGMRASRTILSSWCEGERGKGRAPDSTTGRHTSSELRLVTVSTVYRYSNGDHPFSFDVSLGSCPWR